MKKIDSETKKGLILLAIGLFIVLGVIAIFVLDAIEVSKIVKRYNSFYEEGENHIVYLGKDNCYYCEQFSPIIEATSKEYGFTYDFINITSIGNGDMSKMLEKGKVDANQFGTPTLVIIKNGVAVDYNIGLMQKEELFNFLQKNEIISNEEEFVKEETYLTEIQYNTYETLLKGSEKSVIVIGQTYCSHCIEAKPVLSEIAKERNITINYLNWTEMSADERTKLNDSLPYFSENPSWGTPLFLIIQNGKLVASEAGFSTKANTETFLRNNGIID